ncbi:MAG: alkaline phosphatase family protein [Planctomycetes bacterium]|nr:alkaline phosphatase family protein [Planctomycetota bacterium]
MRASPVPVLLVALAAAVPSLYAAPAPSEAATEATAGKAGVFVLGIDGVDPVILQRLADEGRMPNFARLAAEGTFQKLGTSNPPQSPVAWSNFVTGMNPGGHGIYDFIHRDPKTYTAISSATPPPSGDEATTLDLFGYTLPLWGGDTIVNNRSGKPFWDYLHDAGVETEVYRIPGNFPPTPSGALTLSGMGTDDLRALNGKYAWYTDVLVPNSTSLKAEFRSVRVEDEDEDGIGDTVRDVLLGPPDAMRTYPKGDPTHYLTAPLTVEIDPEDDVAWIHCGDSQAVVREGEWTDWMEVTFEIMPYMPVTGIVRFYAKELRPQFKLYASPLNFSAAAPVTAITTPDDDAAVALFDELGHFYTQGMPEETNALKDGLFDEDDFVKQVGLVHEDGYRMLDLALERFGRGDMTFMYLSDIDLQCHMLWHLGDPKTPGAEVEHPAYRPEAAKKHGHDLEGFYEGIDRVLGHVRDTLPPDALLMVISDHGFQPFTRKVNLNAWLRDQGYLVMLPEGVRIAADGHGYERDTGEVVEGQHVWQPVDASAIGEPAQTGELHDVDWLRTRAYGLGFNGLYLNIEGREGHGIVKASEADGLVAEIMGKLEQIIDPKTNAKVVRRAFRSSDVYSGSRVAEAPDIVVGYDAGYCCSDTSTLGGTNRREIDDNKGGDFTGNHLMDPAVVPGILFCNRKLSTDGHDLTDVTASLLAHFGIPVPDDMVGKSFLD